MRYIGSVLRPLALVAIVATATAAAPRHADAQAQAQGRRALSLEDALRLAMTQSEAIRMAQAGVMRAEGQHLQARSQYLPQFAASLSYQRTLKSQFEALQDDSPEPVPGPGVPPPPPPDSTTYFTPCTRYLAPAGSPEAARIVGLETYARCASGGGGFGIDFQRVGFGAANQYQLGLTGSWTLYSGGRAQAQVAAAGAGRRSASVELASQRAQVALNATQAYFDAVLADRLVAIAESSLAQTEGVLRQTRLARQVGNQSEFELLRAQVSRDNQVPQVIQARTNRDVAYLRLKQLLNVPYSDSVTLTTELADDTSLMRLTAQELGVATSGDAPDTTADHRAPVRSLVEALRAAEADRRAAGAQWLPELTLSTQYGRIAFPTGGVPAWGDFLNNWTVTIGASFPLFTGGRIKGDRMVAEASVREAQARLDQTRELASLDARQALAQLEQAEAALAASAGTAEQAAKAYSIAEVRYREGISTQIELNDSRLLLEQAAWNRATAVRDLRVARMRIALLPNLPLGAGSPAGALGGTTGTGTNLLTPAPTTPAAPRGSTQQNAVQRAATTAATSTSIPPNE